MKKLDLKGSVSNFGEGAFFYCNNKEFLHLGFLQGEKCVMGEFKGENGNVLGESRG